MRLFLAITAVCFLVCCSSSSQHSNSQPSAGDITDARFDAVQAVLAEQGLRAERDPNARNTVRIYVPFKLAADMTEQQAKTLASMTRSRLGDNAIVYVKDEGGRTIARVTSWD